MRRFFVMTLDDREELNSVSDYEMGDFDLRVFWRGKRFGGSIPKTVKLIVENGNPSDYLANPISWAILSERFLEAVTGLIGDDIQRFPAPLYREDSLKPITGYSVINVTRRLDALASPLSSVSRIVLSSVKIPADAHIFRLVGHETHLLVSQEFFDALRGKKLQGMAFIKTKCV